MQRVLSFPMNGGGGSDTGEHVTKRICCSSMFSVGFLCILIGFILGRFAFDQELALTRRMMRDSFNNSTNSSYNELSIDTSNNSSNSSYNELDTKEPVFSHQFAEPFEVEDILKHQRLLWFSHTTRDRRQIQAKSVDDFLRGLGLEMVTSMHSNFVSLVGPDALLSNQAALKDASGSAISIFKDRRPSVQSSSDVLASSTNTLQGEPVYVNFGRDEDYHYLDSIGINVAGRIVMARIGENSLPDVVMTALNHDSIAVLLYVDPQQEGLLVKDLLPPSLQSQLHSLYLTGMTALADSQSALPVELISADDSETILSHMAAKEQSPTNWRGSLNCTYAIGPGFSTPEWSLELTINNAHYYDAYYDVIGAIRGSHEPDRLVVLGGNLDEDTEYLVGASTLMQIAQQLSAMRTNGWEPYRTVAFAFWGKRPSSMALEVVTYLDLDFKKDSIVNLTSARGSLLLSELFENASWNRNFSSSFQHLLPAGPEDELDSSGVPFLSVHLASTGTKLLDDAANVGALVAGLTAELSSNAIVPFSLGRYLKFFNHSISVLNERFHIVARRHKLFLETLTESVHNLTSAIRIFQKSFNSNSMDPLLQRRACDKAVAFTRALACRRDSENPILLTRHPLFSSSFTSPEDTTSGFGELQDLLRAMTSTLAPRDLQRQIVTLVTDIVRCLNNATSSLSNGLDRFLVAT